jgi:hypothetical protein
MLVPGGEMVMENDLQIKQKGGKYGRWVLLGLAGLILLALLTPGLIWLVYQFIHPLLSILIPTP